jgi:hypothetical protein
MIPNCDLTCSVKGLCYVCTWIYGVNPNSKADVYLPGRSDSACGSLPTVEFDTASSCSNLGADKCSIHKLGFRCLFCRWKQAGCGDRRAPRATSAARAYLYVHQLRRTLDPNQRTRSSMVRSSFLCGRDKACSCSQGRWPLCLNELGKQLDDHQRANERMARWLAQGMGPSCSPLGTTTTAFRLWARFSHRRILAHHGRLRWLRLSRSAQRPRLMGPHSWVLVGFPDRADSFRFPT